jgi:hypothetical protein
LSHSLCGWLSAPLTRLFGWCHWLSGANFAIGLGWWRRLVGVRLSFSSAGAAALSGVNSAICIGWRRRLSGATRLRQRLYRCILQQVVRSLPFPGCNRFIITNYRCIVLILALAIVNFIIRDTHTHTHTQNFTVAAVIRMYARLGRIYIEGLQIINLIQ